IGRTEETKGDARENFDRLKSWNDGRVLQESKDSQLPEGGAINLFQCESEKGWQQLLTSVLAAPHQTIIDALFGTGLARPVEGTHREAIRYMNGVRSARDQSPDLNCPIISIDIPSGLNADSEQP